jgi:DNA-binding GntR family transcriptional regulator
VAAPLRDQVLDVVRQGILDFRLRPGQRLIERELMEQLGVSRATVREVIARLASEGLVTNIPQRGAIVSVLTEEEAADIYEMRVSLEGLAAQRFIERATPQQVTELRATFEGYAAAAPNHGDNLDRLRAKDGFYKVLFEGAASQPLTEMLTMLQSRVRLLRATSLSVPGRAQETVQEMRAIVEAVEAKDAQAAAEACARHVRNAAATALARIAESPGSDSDDD